VSDAKVTSTASPGPAPPPHGPVSPGSLLVRAFLAASIVWFLVPWAGCLPFADGEAWYGSVPLEARAQLTSIRRRLARGCADDMNSLFPEGKLFSYAFYGFALVNVATAAPDDETFRSHAIAELERVIPIAEAQVNAPQFGSAQRLVPRGGVIPAGQTNLLRAGYVLVGGKDDAIISSFHDTSALLHRAFAASPIAMLATYPGLIWPVDNCCALESLRLHDVTYGTAYATACERWERWMTERLDAASGMMVAQVTKRGHVVDGPRGCALSWSLALMPGFAPRLARSQYERYRSEWFVHVLGMTGAGEWYPGQEGVMDADTGPVLFGIGAAASGIGIAAAKANGDAANLTGMLRGLEVLAVPTWDATGKEYFLGGVLLADELALWGKTIRVWDRDPSLDAPARWPAPSLWTFWLWYIPMLGLVIFAVAMTVRWILKLAREARRAGVRRDRASLIVAGVEATFMFVWLVVPAVRWLHVVLLVGGADVVESRLLAARDRRPA